ncbi:MAG: TIM barrel protein, partial [Novosphingobium sp.]
MAATATATTGLRLGTTLYSLTTEFHGRDWSFEQIVRKVAEENLGPGLEVVGFQSIKGFPAISDAFADRFAGLIAETGLELSCLGINADGAIGRFRDLDEDELVTYHEDQLHAAKRLGFPLVRYQFAAGPEVIRRLVPLAEKLGIRMALEVHAPHHVQHPDILAFREMYEKVGSPMLGFIPDFGASARAVPPSFYDYVRELGAPEALIETAREIWHNDDVTMEGMHAFGERGLDGGADVRVVVVVYAVWWGVRGLGA